MGKWHLPPGDSKQLSGESLDQLPTSSDLEVGAGLRSLGPWPTLGMDLRVLRSLEKVTFVHQCSSSAQRQSPDLERPIMSRASKGKPDGVGH